MKKDPLSKKSGRWMLVFIIVGILIVGSGMAAAYTLFNYHSHIQEVEQLADTAHTLQENLLDISETGQEKMISEEDKQREAVKERLHAGDTEGIKVVFLTFDDGPSEYSNDVLDILEDKGIKGTFFTIGQEGPVAEEAYQRIIEDGHTLANHTYSHNYDLYNNTDAFLADVQSLEDYQRQITGAEPSGMFRFPGGSLNTNAACIQAVLDKGYNYVDWNVSTGDAAPTPPEVDQIVAAVIGGVHQYDVSVVLSHAEVKENTRQALPIIIDQLKSEGYTFLPMEKDFVYPRQYEL